jgi:fibronectin-binding autotransporter adhesin
MVRIPLAAALLLLLSLGARANNLFWKGGSGNWNLIEENWTSGDQSVRFPMYGATAAFNGGGGTVTVNGGPISTGFLSFNFPGYVVDGLMPLHGITTGITFANNSDVTVNVPVLPGSGPESRVARKYGVGTLTLRELGSYELLQVESGSVVLSGSALSSQVAFSTAEATSLKFGSSSSPLFVGGLTAGAAGTYVSPALPTTGDLIFQIGRYGGSFAGVIQDNGSSRLGVLKTISGTQELTVAQQYSGPTGVSGGTLKFASAGSAAGTAAVNITGGVLLLDNSSENHTDRLSDMAPVTVGGGALVFQGGALAPAAETLGPLSSGSFRGTVTVQPDPAQPAVLTFARFAPGPEAALFFTAPGLGTIPGPGVGSIRFKTAPALLGGGGPVGTPIVGVVPGSFGGDSTPTGFLTYDLHGLRTLTAAEYLENSFALGSNANVRITDRTSVPTAAVANAMRLEPGGRVWGPGALEIASGLIFAAGGERAEIAVSALHLAGPAAAIFTEGELSINGPVTSDTGLHKTGPGSLVLSHANSYTGATLVDQGTLRVENAGGLGASMLAADATIVANGATLELARSIAIAEMLVLSGTGVGGRGALRSIEGDNVWAGAITGSATIGVDTGTLALTGSYEGALTKVGTGHLRIPATASISSSDIRGGSVLTTSNGAVAPGQSVVMPLGTSVVLDHARLVFAPEGSGSDVAVRIGAEAANSPFTPALSYKGSAAIALVRGAQQSLTVIIGANYPFPGSPPPGATPDTLVFAPASGDLGAGENVKFSKAPTLEYGRLPAVMVLQRADGQASASFVTYSSTLGVVPATPSTSTDLATAGSTALFAANTPQSISGSTSVGALINNGQTIDLGTGALFTTGSFYQPGGVILNGGTIRGGRLYFSTRRGGVIYTSLAGATIASSVADPITLFGPGTLTLSGENWSSQILVTSGTANLTGSTSGSVSVSQPGHLTGTGKVGGTVRGGLISPGDGPSTGILTAAGIDSGILPDNPTALAFELRQTGAPNFNSPAASGNDLLRLTHGTSPFARPFTAENEIAIYFNDPNGLVWGDTFLGGIFVDSSSSFHQSIEDATYRFYLSDPLGTVAFEGSIYRALSEFPNFDIQVSTLPQRADFASGAVDGYIMEFRVIPEPSSAALLSFTLAGLTGLRWRPRRDTRRTSLQRGV